MDEEGEEEEWGGIGESHKAVVNGAGKEEHHGDRNANRPPTRDELRAIKEASELFQSSSFKLQIDALLPNVRPKESRIKPLEEFLRTLYTELMDLPSKAPAHPLEASSDLLKQHIAVPYPTPQPNENTAWKVAFERPSDITIVGSWANKVGVKSASSVSWTVDVAVEMPATLFQEKDYLDCRFFHKKAYYLASLASAVSSNKKLNVDVFYDSHTPDNRLTSLVLMIRKDGSPTDFTNLNARIRLLPVLPNSAPISLHHLSPDRCNLRVRSAEGSEEAVTLNTPIYNSDLLLCTAARAHLLQTHELLHEVPSFRDALALLRVWANQRGYSPGPKGRGCIIGFEGKGFFWASLLGVLLVGEDYTGRIAPKAASRRTVGRGLSSYQLFRAALDFLAKRDFAANPVFSKGGSKFPPDTYKSCRSPVFVDSASVNLLSGVPLASLDLLRHDAKTTLELLNNSIGSTAADPFSELFLQDRRQLSTRFDVVLSVDLKNAAVRKSHIIESLDYGSPSQYVLCTLAIVLRRALGYRVHAIAIFGPTNDPRPVSRGNASFPLSKIHIGLVLNQSNAFRLVDHGPAASEQDSQEAIEFRDFWGSKAELRRFKDGRIVESVVWEVGNSDERARIPSFIVSFTVARHLALDAEKDVQTFQRGFDDLLRIPDELSRRLILPGVQPGFKNAIEAFDKLVRDLKGLDEEIPLAILNVGPASSDLRYTSVFAPVPLSRKNAPATPSTMRYSPSMDIVLQFERSGRWPDDFLAIQKMKLAFFERIASALMTKVPGLKAVVVTGEERASPEMSDRSYLEIVTTDGWSFVARIWHDRETSHFDRLLGKKRTSATKDPALNANASAFGQPGRQTTLEAYRFYNQRYVHAPKHHRAIANICHRLPAYSGTVRLVKRWLASHWIFDGHVSGEAIELLCAFVFIGDAKDALQRIDEGNAETPATKELGFFRVVCFLKDWAWESGLFVPVYETELGITKDDSAVCVKAGSGRGVWTISTSEDPEGHVWTSEGPDPLVARRVQALAKSCAHHVLSCERDSLIPRALFLHPSSDYDVLIRLRSDILCRTHQSVMASDAGVGSGVKYANIPSSLPENDQPLRVNFDYARMYYNDLKRVFAGTLEFFFDPYGGSVIGAIWDPSLFDAKPLRVLADYSSMPLNAERNKPKGQVVLNQASVLAEIQRLGDGLVEVIEVQHAHP
ncbi:hypothetical protein M0805_008531 [Coniferiporia weirii]|nr:hypothetical protein M0805_008531 [Coniferiporia weirii]